ncbi:hypothetical protein [Fodinibius salsisoli]|uniref:Uncharacterized protein n=1 Tax=Fodinibius salsisoli TaxID=2820877 RepID=A0ABT3PH12_9BACT|nr:hypothetical protein [Fodinibius salsisoli]MCW9705217.1 hypothetical protein [Fodinibius salsisoli]
MTNFFYGLSLNFKKTLQERVKNEIQLQLNNNWTPYQQFEVFSYDFESPEVKGQTYPKEVVHFLESSPELKIQIDKIDFQDNWNKINSLSEANLIKKRACNRKKLKNLGFKYYKTLNNIPPKLASICKEEINKTTSVRRIEAQTLILNPFYKHRKKQFRHGTLFNLLLFYALILQLLILSIFSLGRPAHFLTYYVLAGKNYKRKEKQLFKDLQKLSEKMAMGYDGSNTVPSLIHLFGEKVITILEDELKQLHQIKSKASSIYVDYILSQLASKSFKYVHGISFDNGKYQVKFNTFNKANDKQIIGLSHWETEIRRGIHDGQGQFKVSATFRFLLEWFNKNEFLPGSEKRVYDFISEQYKKKKIVDRKPSRDTIENKIKKLAKANTLSEVSTYLLDLFDRYSQESSGSLRKK